MQRSLKLASQLGRIITVEHLLTHWGVAVQAAMALIAIVLAALTVAALEVSLLGDESLSAIEAAMTSLAADQQINSASRIADGQSPKPNTGTPE